MNRIHPLRPMRLLAPAALLTALTLAAPAFVRAQDEKKDETPYTWNLKFKKGDVYKFKDTMKAAVTLGGGMEFAFESKSITKTEVKDVADNGDITTLQTIVEGTITFNGMEVPNPEADRKTTN